MASARTEHLFWRELHKLREELENTREQAVHQHAAIERLQARVRSLELGAPLGAPPAPRPGGPAAGGGFGPGDALKGSPPTKGVEEAARPAGACEQPLALIHAAANSDDSDMNDGTSSEEGAPPNATADFLHPTEVPETFFTYCTTRLADPDWRVQLSAAGFLVTSVVFHCVMSYTFLDACRIRLLAEMWSYQAKYDPTCFYQGRHTTSSVVSPDDWIDELLTWRKQIWGISLPIIVVSMLCLWLLALYFRKANLALLAQAAIAEEACILPHWKVLVYFAEVSRTVLVPTGLATGAALQLSTSFDVADIILNCFAVTWLMELDNTLYDLVLGQEQKEAYSRQWEALVAQVPPKRRHRHMPNLIFATDWLVLVGMFFTSVLLWDPTTKDGTEAAAGQKNIDHGIRACLVAAGLCRAVVMRIALWSDGQLNEARPELVRHVLMKVVGTWPVATITIFVTFRWWLSSDRILDWVSFRACSDGDLSACTC